MMLGYNEYKSLITRFSKALIEVLSEENLLACTLFGSVAREAARKESDIDLIILLRQKTAEIDKKIVKVLIAAEDWPEKVSLKKKKISANLSLIIKTEDELKEDPLILLDILDQGKILFDPQKKFIEILERFKFKLAKLGTRKVTLDDGTWYWDLKPDWKPGETVEITL